MQLLRLPEAWACGEGNVYHGGGSTHITIYVRVSIDSRVYVVKYRKVVVPTRCRLE